MSKRDEAQFLSGRPAEVPKLVKDRLIRIETRLVKYQESNVVAIDDLTNAVDQLAGAMQEVIYLLQEAADNADSPEE